MRKKNIRIVIADDHYIFREGLKHVLEETEDIEIVGEAADGKSLVEVTGKQNPDVVLTDIEMPNMTGLQAVRTILAKQPEIGVIALSTFGKNDYIIDMMEAGALGYLLKDNELDHIKAGIYAVYNRQPYYSKTISRQLLQKMQGTPCLFVEKQQVRLTKTEKDILQKICDGLTNKEIGSKLDYTTRTIEVYRNRMMEKLEIHSPAGLVIYAIRNGIYSI